MTEAEFISEIVTQADCELLLDVNNVYVNSWNFIQAGDLMHCAQTCDFSSFTFLPKNNSDMAPRGGKVEGYLYSDTYYVDVGNFVPKFFLERLLSTFKDRVVDNYASDIKASNHSLNQIITVASLIEEETRNASERPVVAGIIWKRLDQHMILGIDAAVRYVLDRGNDPLTSSDLQVDSPYNLRKFQGLPPGPIGSPSLSSIKAALHPEPSPYFYYLHDAKGFIHYAITNDEQNANREKYLK